MESRVTEREKMHARLDRRQAYLLSLFAKVRRDIDAGRHDGTESAREWLESFCVGVGVQICSGEFSLGDSLGIDCDPKTLATDHWCWADRYAAGMPPLDYVVTNYLECFPDPLRVLIDWRARLRPGGVLAIVARDSNCYEAPRGPLVNHRRVSCFTLTTLRFYLERAGCDVKGYSFAAPEMRVVAVRPDAEG